MEEFLSGFVLGIGVAVPFGPVNILIMSYALRSYKKAFIFGFGAMSCDIFYLLFSSVGLFKILNNEILLKIFAIFGVIFLLYMAYEIYKNSNNVIEVDRNLKDGNNIKIFLRGFFINMLNPYVVMFWIGISATLVLADSGFAWARILGLIVSIFAWITLFPLAIFKNSKLINQKIYKIISYTSALILIFFAFSLIYKILILSSFKVIN
ncbi:LysE family translocator [Campylobacter sp. FMV-PI01]|uniref:LysE family translocator n=1 Tax=Campylobacter portucalensis TaxID=2608384 RepID=A0A6L5WKH6_9BACT|nr:LysE family translocator [Campylobacter portucalensis]MSN96515.1 LysE family translocator [Campylobacter portucalensis]